MSSEWAWAILLSNGLITTLPAPYLALKLLVKKVKYALRTSIESWSEGYDDKLNEEAEAATDDGAADGKEVGLLGVGEASVVVLTAVWRLLCGKVEATTDFKLELLFSVIDKVDFGELVLIVELWGCWGVEIGI